MATARFDRDKAHRHLSCPSAGANVALGPLLNEQSYCSGLRVETVDHLGRRNCKHALSCTRHTKQQRNIGGHIAENGTRKSRFIWPTTPAGHGFPCMGTAVNPNCTCLASITVENVQFGFTAVPIQGNPCPAGV